MSGQASERGATRHFDALVFDLDGTILDSHDLVARTINRVLDARGHPTIDPQRVHSMTGLPLEDIFSAVLPAAAAEEMLTCVDEYRERFQHEVLPVVEPIPGAPEALDRISASRQWPLGIATGRLTETAEEMLARCGLRQHFRVVLGADAAPRPKPYPDLLLEVLGRMGQYEPTRILVVGDSAADVAMALAAGASACAVTWGAQDAPNLLRADPTWCIDTWAELLDLLGLRQTGADYFSRT